MKNKKEKYIEIDSPRKESPLNPNLILDKLRIINIFGDITEEMSKKVVKELIKLDYLSNNPITIVINSAGGNCIDGLAIVDAMNMCNSPVHTIITGMSASMAGVISVCGDVRAITENGFWMEHPMAGGTYDYKKFLIDYVEFLKAVDRKILKILVSRTNLTAEDIQKMSNGELWLDAQQCVDKGVCHQIVQPTVYAKSVKKTKTKKAKKSKKK